MAKRKLYKKLSIKLNHRFGVFIGVFVVIGIALLVISLAAGPTSSYEAENASLASGAVQGNDASASGGKYVEFKSGGSNGERVYGPGGIDLTDWPNHTNTGVQPGVTLTRHNGNFYTTSDNQLIQNLEIYGTVAVCHDNVTIRNVKVVPTWHGILTGGQSQGFFTCPKNPQNTLIEYVEIDGSNIDTILDEQGESTVNAIWNQNFTARFVHIHGKFNSSAHSNGFGTGILPWGNATVENSYLHTFGGHSSWGPSGTHREAIHIEEGDNVTIRNNVLLMDREEGTTGGLWTSYGAYHENIVIEGNLVGSYGGYAIGCGGSKTNTIGMVCKNNAITTLFQPFGGYWGSLTNTGPVVEYSGNYWYDGPDKGLIIGTDGRTMNPQP